MRSATGKILRAQLFRQATGGQEITARLASIAQHVLQLRLTIVLALLQAVCAIVLGVTLYAITRNVDSGLAMLAMIFRVGEGLLAAISTRATLELLWLGTSAGPRAPDAVTLRALGTYLLDGPAWNMAAILFAMGSTLFSYLFLRGRTIPVLLAWIGVIASVLLAVALPLQLAGFLKGPATSYVWMPMLAFEVPLGFWLPAAWCYNIRHDCRSEASALLRALVQPTGSAARKCPSASGPTGRDRHGDSGSD